MIGAGLLTLSPVVETARTQFTSVSGNARAHPGTSINHVIRKRRAKMKKVILCALVLAANGVLVNSVLSQEIVPRYLVTYVRFQNPGPIRAATAVTVTNQSNESCAVQVEWFRSAPLTSLCILEETIPS